MRIAVASGKGGTGKTTIATSLALSLAGQWEPGSAPPIGPLFLDCDVEAPNAHLFLQPEIGQQREAGLLIPTVDESRCSHCSRCVEVCQYHAIAAIGKKTLVFSQLCHGCGSCALNCPEGAIRETWDVIGLLERGVTPSGVDFARGALNIGEPMAVPVIRQLKQWAKPDAGQIVIVDASPGTSCPVVEAVRGADFLLLVTEPTPFGLHDLRLAVEMAGELQIPAGVALNRHQDTNGYARLVEAFCREQGLPILLRIPFERGIAAGMAQGKNLIEIHPKYRELFVEMFYQISHQVEGKTELTPAGCERPKA